jgi:ribonuclease BN (tRNA processing enzyme)
MLESENEVLVLEAGVSFLEVKKALNFQTSNIVGVLVTHSHRDHSKYLNQYYNIGCEVRSPQGLYGADLLHKESFKIGEFTVMPLKVIHDVETYMFLINHSESGVIAFITDTHYVPYRFNVNQFIIECNYDSEVMDRNLINGKLEPFLRNRIIKSHMSLETVKGVFKSNNIKEVNNIVLTHLSDSNSDAAKFKREISALTGKNVHIATKGLKIDLNKVF